MLGTNIGNYKVTATIGEGGMGAVYRMVHESLGRAAAVKVLLPAISSNRDIVTRFFNEARSAASIRHPGIVEVFDFGFLPDGQAYIIMEHLDGESLGNRLRRAGRMPHAAALQIMRLVARALHAAHERGIVHRDLKPDNIFLVPDPDMPTGERIKLLDFGIAKLGGDGLQAGLTQTGAVMGTPMYMAPEQCRGAGAVDRRADLYALGCILYEMLCGRPPFVAEGVGDLIARHQYFQPDPPRALDPGIAPPLEALVLSLLAKDPAHRPQTALALAEAIDQLGQTAASAASWPPVAPASMPAGSPVTTLSGAAAAASVAPRPGRRSGLVVAVGVTAAVAAAVVAIIVASNGGARPEGPVAEPSIDAAPGGLPADAGEVARLPAIDAAIASDLPADGSGSIVAERPAGARRTLSDGKADEARRTLEKLRESARKAEATQQEARRIEEARKADEVRKADDVRKAEEARKADEARQAGSRASSGESQAELAEKLNEEGKTLMFQHKYAEAIARFRQAIARAPGEPRYFFNLCVAQYQEGRFGEALTACKAVANRNPSAELRAKASKMIETIRREATSQGIALPN